MSDWGRPFYWEWDGEKAVPTNIPPPLEDQEYFEKYRKVARTCFSTPYGDVQVSTVFLVIDHQFGEGPPVLWETMVFGGLWNEYQWRYISREDAEVGHTHIVEAIKEGKEPHASESRDPATNDSDSQTR